MIEVEDLSFAFEGNSVLKNVSFSVHEKEFVAIFGPNGGGKTTLLKLLAGLLKKDRGRIKMPGRIGWVPQNFAADPLFPISVLDVVLMGRLSVAPRLFGFRKCDREAALEALRSVGMEKWYAASFSALSGGQKQRVLIARALVSNPEVLLLDEATANVDTASIASLMQLLRSLKLTVLMVTHDLKTALDNCDRLLCVQEGVKPMSRCEVCKHFEDGLYHGRSR
ncbi:MAG: ABC transporter ATP-binding protein [Chlamydiales bacterium]|nr:ABC transporter ATP-binding protein [Chlamydiales bacterium]